MANPVGRPPSIDAEALRKLEEVFALGGTDKEACLYAGISTTTLYKYQEEHPDFAERKAALKETPVLLARRTVVASLEKDVNSAWRMVERKDPDLNPKQVIDHTTKGEKLENSTVILALAEKLNDLHREGSISSDGAKAVAMGTKTPDTNL
jgi:hypothetical protein